MDRSTAARRIAEFEERFAKAQATDVVDLGWGYGLLQRDFPASWHHNRVVVTAPAPAEEVVAAADEVLAGMDHRLVVVEGAVPGAAAAFEEAGYGSRTLVLTMLFEGGPPTAGQDLVEAVSAADLRPSLIRDLRDLLPDADDESISQLADRVRLFERSAETTFLAVRTPDGDVVARTEMYAADGVAQLENLVTRPGYRGRGYARALVADFLHRARSADLAFLTAQADDWPRDWYRRLGFHEIRASWVFQRTP